MTLSLNTMSNYNGKMLISQYRREEDWGELERSFDDEGNSYNNRVLDLQAAMEGGNSFQCHLHRDPSPLPLIIDFPS